ncbi:MAG TPA: glycosyltransferase family 39 protein [bacterium]|nr:glycosyltransferase family 39 protein [bacterium]
MLKDLSKKEKFFLVGILLLAAFLIFFRLTRASLQRDDAHYSFRALGYTDYMSSDEGQTTPLQWFAGEMPLWTKFSFHDHPPLVFLLQHIFFKIFGANDVAAKLPFAVAGLCLVYVVFLLGRGLFSVRVGLVAAFVLAINNYHVWIARIGYFESVTVLLMALCLLFLLKGSKNDKNFIMAGIFLGLACLSKYTAFILLPIFIIYALINFRRSSNYCPTQNVPYKNIYFWSGLLLALILFLPIIFYNLKMFQVRGHADIQFSALLNLPTKDWPILASRSNWQPQSIFTPLKEIVRVLGGLVSWPWMIIDLLACVYVFFKIYLVKDKKIKQATIFLASIFLVTVLFFVMTGGTAEIYLVPFNFMMALALGLAVVDFYVKILVDSRWLKGLFFVIAAVFIAYGIFFAYNTNQRLTFIESNFFVSKSRLEDLGFNELQKFLSEKFNHKFAGTVSMVFPTLNRFNPLEGKSGIYAGQEENKSIFIYDDNTLWFSRLWYFERWSFYNFFPLIATRNLRILNLPKVGVENGLAIKEGFYFIKSLQKYQLDKYVTEDPGCVDKLAQALDKIKEKEVFEIKNRIGQPVFRVYKFWNLKPLAVCQEYL